MNKRRIKQRSTCRKSKASGDNYFVSERTRNAKSMCIVSRLSFKGATSPFEHLEKFSLNFSSSSFF